MGEKRKLMQAEMANQLAGKVILITGGARGIGGATAQLCAARGATVIIADIDQADGEALAASIREQQGDVQFAAVDVQAPDQVEALLGAVGAKYGRLDVLICAAGIIRGSFLQPDEFPLEAFEQVIDINVKGVFLCAKYATPLLAASGRGVMILIASGAGIKGPSSSLAYGASKAAVNGLGMTLENYLRPRNIRVNVVCPGEIDTKLKTEVIAYGAERAGQPGEAAVQEARQTRLGTPDGVARILAFLASDEADYVRGILFTR
jgi:NAD(P)-dependent dehydrogenase (short-subunit alcohol dehydrogenase family)